MQAGFWFIQGNQRWQSIAHQRAEQAQVFERSIRQFVGAKSARHIRKLEVEGASTALIGGVQPSTWESIVDRLGDIQRILTDDKQGRQNSRQIVSVMR